MCDNKKENDLIQMMFDSGVFESMYEGIIEIHPRLAMNSFVFETALLVLQEDYKIVKITNVWYRAFKKVKQ